MNAPDMLPAWLDAAAVPPARPAGSTLGVPTFLPAPGLMALPGLECARPLNPLQRLQQLQQSGLAECGFAGEPLYHAWRQFLRGRGSSTLVVDAAGLDARALGHAAVLDAGTGAAGRGPADCRRPARYDPGRTAPAARN